jgi:hypothetical protein
MLLGDRDEIIISPRDSARYPVFVSSLSLLVPSRFTRHDLGIVVERRPGHVARVRCMRSRIHVNSATDAVILWFGLVVKLKSVWTPHVLTCLAI